MYIFKTLKIFVSFDTGVIPFLSINSKEIIRKAPEVQVQNPCYSVLHNGRKKQSKCPDIRK
jgi:hypothetical protein